MHGTQCLQQAPAGVHAKRGEAQLAQGTDSNKCALHAVEACSNSAVGHPNAD